MNTIDELASSLQADDPIQTRINIFRYVRDIPYQTGVSATAEEVIERHAGDCGSKSKLLCALLNKAGYKTRMVTARYTLRDAPPEVQYIPGRIDYHHAPEVNIDGTWVLADVTYDPPLRSIGFASFDWDGMTSTPLAERPLALKREGENNPAFDEEFARFQRELAIACDQYPRELEGYSQKFNDMLKSARQ